MAPDQRSRRAARVAGDAVDGRPAAVEDGALAPPPLIPSVAGEIAHDPGFTEVVQLLGSLQVRLGQPVAARQPGPNESSAGMMLAAMSAKLRAKCRHRGPNSRLCSRLLPLPGLFTFAFSRLQAPGRGGGERGLRAGGELRAGGCGCDASRASTGQRAATKARQPGPQASACAETRGLARARARANHALGADGESAQNRGLVKE